MSKKLWKNCCRQIKAEKSLNVINNKIIDDNTYNI